jgi:sRNA-binding regulator protein Hfq
MPQVVPSFAFRTGAEVASTMKDESTAAQRALEPETFTNRKLIRPTLTRDQVRSVDNGRERGERAGNGKKTAPPDQTHAENFYYQKQMQAKTSMVIVLQDGEEIHGVIEWYDRTCLKLVRSGSSLNLLVYKSCIKYMYKESENGNGRR